MSIYQENVLSDQAFEEVNNLLDDQPSQIQNLTLKINQLQKIITTLTRTNERLIVRIEELEFQLEQKNSLEDTTFNQEYSIMHCNFNDIEDMLKQYKEELMQYQEFMRRQLLQKNTSIQQLQQDNEELVNENERLQIRTEEMQMENDILEQTKENLISQIEQLESSLRKSKMESPRYPKYSQYSDLTNRLSHPLSSDFNISVQIELQKLIEKLVKELQNERYLKKKLTDEIKQLQKDMLEQQKQIMSKNSRIYDLQITVLKKSKSTNRSTIARTKPDTLGNKQTPKQSEQIGRISKDREATSSKTKMKTFTLMQLMNECTVLSSKEKLIVSLKIIDLYLKKFQRNDYSSQILQSLAVCNFTPFNPQLCQLKINHHITKDQDNQDKDQNQFQLGWNLVFILDNLFNQMATKDREFGQTPNEEKLLQAITFFLQNREENNMDSVMELRKVVEEAFTQRTR